MSTTPPQSPDLNPIEMVWDELDCRVKEKLPTSAEHMWELLQTVGNAFQVKLVERMPRMCKAVIKAKGGDLKKLKNILICLTLFWLLHDSMCHFIVLMSSILFYNVENSLNK